MRNRITFTGHLTSPRPFRPPILGSFIHNRDPYFRNHGVREDALPHGQTLLDIPADVFSFNAGTAISSFMGVTVPKQSKHLAGELSEPGRHTLSKKTHEVQRRLFFDA